MLVTALGVTYFTTRRHEPAINIDRLGGRSAELPLNPAREAGEDRAPL